MSNISVMGDVYILAAALLCTSVAGGARLEFHVGTCTACKYTTVPAAIAAVRAARASNKTAVQSYNILLHEGSYEAFAVDPLLDSGTASSPLVIQGYSSLAAGVGVVGEAPPVISAGVAVPKNLWKPAAASAKLTPGAVVANISSLKLTAADFGALPTNGDSVDGCDQLVGLKMQMHHTDDQGVSGLVLARYPNIDNVTGAWKFLHAAKQRSVADGKGLAPDPKDAARVRGWVAQPGGAWVHGYWAWDWADSIIQINAVDNRSRSGSFPGGVRWTNATVAPHGNARYIGINILSELDAPSEYYIDSVEQAVYYLPAVPLESWEHDPVLTNGSFGVNISGTSFVTLAGLDIQHSKGVGVLAEGVSNVEINGCTVRNHGASAATITGGSSGIRDSSVSQVGCRGLTLSGGSARALVPGNMHATNNTITNFALLKRTYQPGVHWGGYNNSFSFNTISNGPHNCILGGGNEVDPDAGAAANIFEYNHIEKCSYESSDTGAFYTCGQQANAFVNPGNELRHNTFANIFNVGGVGIAQHHITIQAVYLDDEMSSWHVWNNSFINCTTGTFVGGGRLNSIHDNYYQNVETCHHFDNRGMSKSQKLASSPWPTSPSRAVTGAVGGDGGQARHGRQGNVNALANWNCTANSGLNGTACIPGSNTAPSTCGCSRGALLYELAGPAGKEWELLWPGLAQSVNDSKCSNEGSENIPCYNVVANNTYCASKTFADQSASTFHNWNSIMANNREVKCRL